MPSRMCMADGDKPLNEQAQAGGLSFISMSRV